jgi:hypothetical protein
MIQNFKVWEILEIKLKNLKKLTKYQRLKINKLQILNNSIKLEDMFKSLNKIDINKK